MSEEQVRDSSLTNNLEGKENHGIACSDCAGDIKILAFSCMDYKHEQMPYFGERNMSDAVRSIQVLHVLKWQLNWCLQTVFNN